LEPALNRPFIILRNGSRLLRGKAAQDGQHEFAFHSAGVQIFLFKIDKNAAFLQLPHQFQTVGGVSCKPADGLGDDVVNPPVLAVGNHPEKLRTLFLFGSGDAFVGIHAGKRPRGIRLDVGFIMPNLRFQTFLLLVAVGGNTAVGRDTQLRRFIFPNRVDSTGIYFRDLLHVFTSLVSVTYYL